MMKRAILLLALLGLPVLGRAAGVRTYGGSLIDDATLSYSTSPVLDLTNIDFLSMQAVYSSATLSSANLTFSDGRKSTGTITVATATVGQFLANASTAAFTITNVSYSSAALAGAVLTINGERFKEGAGGNWTVALVASNTAVSLAAALNASSAFDASASSNVVRATATATGTAPHSWVITSSTPTALSTTTFSNGRDNFKIVIKDQILEAGVSFTPVATASGTAKALSNAIMANTSLSAVLSSTWSLVSVSSVGVITATASVVGTDANSWALSVVGGNSGLVTLGAFSNGAASGVDLTNDILTISTHGLTTGFPVWPSATSGTLPTGLTSGTTYFIIKNTGSSVKLATSQANALAGTAVDMTAVTSNGAFKLNPTAFTGAWGFDWQSSNDGVNWFTLPNISSVTYASPDNTMMDGEINYRYLRIRFNAGTFGGMNFKVIGNGKSR